MPARNPKPPTADQIAAALPEGEDLLQLFRTVKHIAHAVARTMPAGDSHVDDLYAAGLLALVEATRRFDARRGVTFLTFARPRVQGAMLDEMRRLDTVSREHRRAIRRGQRPAVPRHVELSAAECVADDMIDLDEHLARRQSIERLRHVERRLPDRLRLVLRLRMESDWSLREIADHLGVTQGRACQLIGAGVRILREEMLADEGPVAAAA